MSSRSRKGAALALTTLCAGLLLASLKLPLWQMRLEAPQYRDQEALRVEVYPHSFRGDLREIRVLNQYIGVHVPQTLPEFRWLPILLLGSAAAAFAAGFMSRPLRRGTLVAMSTLLSVGLLCAALQARAQMHDIGHKRDARTILAGVKDFTPPFIGTSKIAQFTVSSRFGAGAWLIALALTLQLGLAWQNKSPKAAPSPRKTRSGANTQAAAPCPSLS